MKQLLRRLEPEHDNFREAMGHAQELLEALPYGDYPERYPGLAREPMIVAMHKQFSEKGLGGLHVVESEFPQSLRFKNEDFEVIFRKRDGFRYNHQSEKPDTLFEPTARVVLFWSYPSAGVDSIKALNLQLFTCGGSIEEAIKLSHPIPLATEADNLPRKAFIPTAADAGRLDFEA